MMLITGFPDSFSKNLEIVLHSGFILSFTMTCCSGSLLPLASDEDTGAACHAPPQSPSSSDLTRGWLAAILPSQVGGPSSCATQIGHVSF